MIPEVPPFMWKIYSVVVKSRGSEDRIPAFLLSMIFGKLIDACISFLIYKIQAITEVPLGCCEDETS